MIGGGINHDREIGRVGANVGAIGNVGSEVQVVKSASVEMDGARSCFGRVRCVFAKYGVAVDSVGPVMSAVSHTTWGFASANGPVGGSGGVLDVHVSVDVLVDSSIECL